MPSRAYLINGDIYYSPNSDRDVLLPRELNVDDILLFNYVGVEAFEEPFWWSERVPWLGFMPMRPVCWNGALVEDLGNMPRRLLANTERVAYMLPIFSQNRWLAVETLIREVLGLFSERFNIQYSEPYSTRKWGYTNGHPTEEKTWYYARQGRDWFAMWIALLYWVLKVIPEEPRYMEGFDPTRWFRVLAIWDKARISAWESLRCAPLLQRFWDANRSGVFLHNPDDQPNQPSALWFDHCGMPVWYRWGPREIAQSRRNGFRLMLPPPEILQAATTVISPSVPSYATGAGCEWGATQNYEHFTPASPPQFSPTSPPQFSPTSPLTTQPGDDNLPPPSSPSQASKLVYKNGRLRTVERSGRAVWGPFHQKHEERHQKMLLNETPATRQKRLNRERNPPVASAAVYVWEWDLETPPKFVRRLVLKKERIETLEDAYPGEACYDSFCNEWTLCSEWVDDSYEPSDDEADEENGMELHRDEEGVNSPARAPSTQVVPSQPSASTPPAMPSVTARDDLLPPLSEELEESQQEVLNVLTKFYGFLPPRGLSTNVGPLARPSDIRTLITIIGMTTVKMNNAFWGTPMGKACIDFGLPLASKGDREPPAAIWDLSSRCRDPLKYSPRLRCIKRVRAGSQRLYMFDFGELATHSWNIAVYTASAALMVCRLHPDFRDEDIAVELSQLGVPFRTLQKRAGLNVVRDELPCSMTPMVFSDHKFTRADYDFWKQRCQAILVSQRGRAAILRGGYLRRLALEEGVGVSEVLRGPSGLHENHALNFSAWDENGVEYVDDDLTGDELDLLCGIYQSFTGVGVNIKKQSWYPLVSTFEGSGDDQGRWHSQLEENYSKRTSSILNEKDPMDPKLLLSATQWRDKTRGFGEARRAAASVEKQSTQFLTVYCSR